MATLIVARGGPGGALRFETFQVPFTPGASVLDGLMWIREHRDASLAFRFACINANVCKECVMRIDGRNGYACTARLRQGETLVEPLAGKRHLRDLVCDTVPPKERRDSGGDLDRRRHQR
jgi:succinate dehydrogenase/fumarate reductase-like Fe-S protein